MMERNINGLMMSVLGTLTITAALSGCGGKEWRAADGAAWATAYHITYCSAVSLEDSVQAVIASVNSSLSVFEENSTVSRINRNEDLQVDTLLTELFEVAQRVNRLSEGAFDPTVSPAIELWGFGSRQAEEPDSVSIDSIRSLVGMGDCMIRDGKMIKKSPQTEFNFSAIAKGYGCDLMGRMFKRNGVEDFLVEIGGEITASGRNPQGEPWKISVVTPEEWIEDAGKIIVCLSDCGMATSGNYRNFRDTSKGRIGHTINPATCRPVDRGVFSATVIAPTAIFADALATACMVMSPDKAIRMIDRIEGTEALLIVCGEDGAYRLVMSVDFNRYLYENQGI